MEKSEILAAARTAGLTKAAHEFPDDVVIAASAAAQARNNFLPPADPAAEPWPPMRTRSTP